MNAQACLHVILFFLCLFRFVFITNSCEYILALLISLDLYIQASSWMVMIVLAGNMLQSRFLLKLTVDLKDEGLAGSPTKTNQLLVFVTFLYSREQELLVGGGKKKQECHENTGTVHTGTLQQGNKKKPLYFCFQFCLPAADCVLFHN